MEHDIRKAFSGVGYKCSNSGMLAQLSSAASQYCLNAKELATRFTAYTLNHEGASFGQVTPAALEGFLANLARSCNKENHFGRTPASKWGAKSWDELTDTMGTGPRTDQKALPTTPLAAKAASTPLGHTSPLTPQSAPKTAFKIRTNAGQVVTTLNTHLPKGEHTLCPAPPLQQVSPQLPSPYRYMLEKLEDKVAAMQARMEAAVAAAKAALGSAWSEPVPVGTPVQEESTFFGRVLCDAEGAQLNEASLLLEGDQLLSEGARCRLNVSQLGAFRLFAGQIVVLRGTNPTGSTIMARAIYTHLPPPLPPAGPTAMDLDRPSSSSHPGSEESQAEAAFPELSMVVAAGPFTLTDDCSYDPLQELLAALKKRPPQVLLLVGPFVDEEHPLVVGGQLEVTYQQLFKQQVLSPLEAWHSELNSGCQVVLMPSLRDVHHHLTFPQPAFRLHTPEQVVSVQNPSSFRLGSIVVAGTATDVLRHLSSSELARGPAGDRVAALASHLLGQRCMYPLYPPQQGVALDTTADYALELQWLPSLMVLPSDLAPFAKVVPAAGPNSSSCPAGSSSSNAICINPGRLAKGSSGGTYASIAVFPITAKEGGSSSSSSCSDISSRCRVDIMRI